MYGESGTGKTSIMAKSCITAYNLSLQRAKKAIFNATIIIRFIGTSASSTTSRLLMKSICQQLCRLYSKLENIPDDYAELVQYFRQCIGWATAQRPIILFLDSLDHLSNDDNGRKLNWLPLSHLPRNVKIVVSTQPLVGQWGSKSLCLQVIRAALRGPTSGELSPFVPVQALPYEEGEQLLDVWLKRSRKTLTSDQLAYVMQCFKNMPVPLYLKLCFQRALRWASYDTGDAILLEPKLDVMIVALFKKLEVSYGKICVSHALGAISAAKVGLSEAELEDVLSCDEAALNETFQWWLPPFRRLPPLLWARMRDDLGSLLHNRSHFEIRAYTWYHACVRSAAEERYLNPDTAQNCHMKLANYFMGRWAEKKKPFKYGEGKLDLFGGELAERYGSAWPDIKAGRQLAEEDRKVAEQPLYVILGVTPVPTYATPPYPLSIDRMCATVRHPPLLKAVLAFNRVVAAIVLTPCPY